jgi:hypothetical protein
MQQHYVLRVMFPETAKHSPALSLAACCLNRLELRPDVLTAAGAPGHWLGLTLVRLMQTLVIWLLLASSFAAPSTCSWHPTVTNPDGYLCCPPALLILSQ